MRERLTLVAPAPPLRRTVCVQHLSGERRADIQYKRENSRKKKNKGGAEKGEALEADA